MVFLSGPRQCGKTTLAKELMGNSGTYYNWDVPRDRAIIKAGDLEPESNLWVFDELHKYKRWRNWLKGTYDEFGKERHILVTGSAKLELFSKGGDSLQGRYFHHRLHPLSLGEVTNSPIDRSMNYLDALFETPIDLTKEHADALRTLLQYGGFPEPFTTGDAKFLARWRSTYGVRLVREDIRDLYRFGELDQIELLYDRLSETIGSSITYNRYARDLEVAYESVKRWVDALEGLYGLFRIPPFGPPKIRAVKKEQKLYSWDWTRTADPGARLENLVAVHLLTFVHWCCDQCGEKVELRYFRDTDGREVDFVLLRNRKPWVAIEVKSSEQPLESSMRYLLERADFPYAFQLTLKSDRDFLPDKIHLKKAKIRRIPLAKFLANLP